MWTLLSFIAGVLSAAQIVVIKRVVGNFRPVAITWVAFAVTALATCGLALREWPIALAPTFWGWLLFAVLADILGKLFVSQALESGELSYIASLRLATPLFVLGFTPLFTQQSVTPLGALGVALITLGLFLIPADGSAAPRLRLGELFGQRSGRLMVAGVVLIALTSTLDVPGVAASATYTWVTLKLLADCLILAPFAWGRLRQPGAVPSGTEYGLLLAGGGLAAASVILHFYAIGLAPVAYVVSLKSIAAILPVAAGYVVLREKRALARLRGAALMVLGTILLHLG